MVSVKYSLALVASSAFLASAARLPRGPSSGSKPPPEPRWGQSAVHLPGHKSAVFIGGRSEGGDLLHRADVLNISALHEGIPSAQAWSSLPLPDGVPPSTFAAAAALPGQDSSFLVLGGNTESCTAAPGYIFTGNDGQMALSGSWSALASASPVYDRSHAQAVPVHNSTSSQRSILVTGKASARAGCDGADLSDSPATTESWVASAHARGTSISIDVAPVPQHLRRDVPVRDYAAVAIEGNNGTEKVLYLGGLTSYNTVNSLRHLWALEVPTGEWHRVRTAGPVSGGLYGHTATLMPDNKIVVVGGYVGAGRSRTVSSSTLVLDLDQSPPTWSVAAEAQPRVFHSALAVGHKLIIAFGKVEHPTKRAPNDELAFLDTKDWTWSDQFHPATQTPSPSSSSPSPATSSPSASSASPSASQPAASASAPRVASTSSAEPKSVLSNQSGLASGSSSGSAFGLESTVSPWPTAGPTGDNTQHTSSSGHGISGRTLAAILAPTMAVVLALVLWLIFGLCVWRCLRRRRAQATDEKRGRNRVVSSTGRGVVPTGRRPIESSSTFASDRLWNEDMQASRSWSPIEQPERALVVTSPDDKYTPIRANSVRNLHDFRGRASLKRARETARFQAVQAPNEAPVSVPAMALPPPAAESSEVLMTDDANWFAHPPRSQAALPSPSNGSAVSYPYLQGVPPASRSSVPLPEEDVARAAPTVAPPATELTRDVIEPQTVDSQDADQSGWFEELTSEQPGNEQSQGSPVLSSIPVMVGDESEVDPFRRLASDSTDEQLQQRASSGPGSELPEWMQSPSPVNSPSMQSACSLRGVTPMPAPLPAPPTVPASAPWEKPPPMAAPSRSVTSPVPEKVQRTSSGRPLPSAPGGRRTPSAYALLYERRQSVTNEQASAPASPPQQAAVRPSDVHRHSATTHGREDAAVDALHLPAAGPRPEAVPRVLPPPSMDTERPSTFHESTLRPPAVQAGERPGSYHGSTRQVSGAPSAPTARMMRPGGAPGVRPASASQTSLALPLPAPQRLSQLFAPSEGSRASSPTPSERLLAPEGSYGLPPAFRLSESPFLPTSPSSW